MQRAAEMTVTTTVASRLLRVVNNWQIIYCDITMWPKYILQASMGTTDVCACVCVKIVFTVIPIIEKNIQRILVSSVGSRSTNTSSRIGNRLLKLWACGLENSRNSAVNTFVCNRGFDLELWTILCLYEMHHTKHRFGFLKLRHISLKWRFHCI